MATEAELFNAQFLLRKKVMPDDLVEQEFKSLERSLRMAKFKENRLAELEVMGPGMAMSLLREVQMLRAYRDQVTALYDACEDAADEEKPEQAAAAVVGLGAACDVLSRLYRHFGEDLDKLDQEEAKKAPEDAQIVVLGDGRDK